MSACQPSGFRPSVWKDDDGWTCDQVIQCLECNSVWCDTLVEGVPFEDAIAASSRARPRDPSLNAPLS